MLWTSFLVQRYFEPCWFQIYNYFLYIYIASKVAVCWRWSIEVKKQQKTGFFDSNELPYRGCNFWCSKAVEKIIIYFESGEFKVPMYQKWSFYHQRKKKLIFFFFISHLHFSKFLNFFFGNYSAPRYLFNDTKFIKI